MRLYRCPACHSVLKRDESLDELLKEALGKAHFECGFCHHFMPASEVLSGKWDISPGEASADGSDRPSLRELLGVLREEHKPGYVYRGQTRPWPGPLVPSIFRGLVQPEPIRERVDPQARLREFGRTFHRVGPADESQGSDRSERMKLLDYLRHVFGFPLSQLLAQQCGIQSEGLDVTTSPDVAAFFAAFEFGSNRFVSGGGEVGVVYRFEVPLRECSLGALARENFYSCPTYLDAQQALGSIGTCASWEEALRTFDEYQGEYAQRLFQSDAPARPLEVLRLPAGGRRAARVVQQQAGLLLPDFLLSKFYAAIDPPPPPGKAELPGLSAVEDLSARPGVEAFTFAHSEDDHRCLDVSPAQLLPKNDPFMILLYTFLLRCTQFMFSTPHGIISNPGGHRFVQ